MRTSIAVGMVAALIIFPAFANAQCAGCGSDENKLDRSKSERVAEDVRAQPHDDAFNKADRENRTATGKNARDATQKGIDEIDAAEQARNKKK